MPAYNSSGDTCLGCKHSKKGITDKPCCECGGQEGSKYDPT